MKAMLLFMVDLESGMTRPKTEKNVFLDISKMLIASSFADRQEKRLGYRVVDEAYSANIFKIYIQYLEKFSEMLQQEGCQARAGALDT